MATRSSSAGIGRTASVNGATLAYDITGRGPAVALISGGGTLDRRMWDAQVAALAPSHTVLCYDVRGIGGSSPPDGSFSHSDDLHALLQSIGIARASLVGLSFGAAVAIDFALDHPEMVQALVLAAPGLSNDKDANVQAALAAAEVARTDGLSVVVDAIVNNDTVLASAGDEVRRHVRMMYLKKWGPRRVRK
jgi:pimeloyl-ACP methyl ester carboxylesterase